jgi:spermidine synthase
MISMNKQQTIGLFPNPVIEDNSEPILLKSIESEYQFIEIFEHPIYGNQLVIDGDLQISASDHAYNVALVSPLLSHGNLSKVCILGGGDGGVLCELLNACERIDLTLEKVTIVDIDRQVTDLSRRYLKELCGEAFEHPKTDLIIGDAFQLLESHESFDAIVYDLTMNPIREEVSMEDYLNSVLKSIYYSLKPGGMLSMQVCGENENDPMLEIPRSEYLELVTDQVRKEFAGYVLQYVFIPSFEETWTFLTAQKQP